MKSQSCPMNFRCQDLRLGLSQRAKPCPTPSPQPSGQRQRDGGNLGETSQDPAVGLFIILFIKLKKFKGSYRRSSRVHTSTDLTIVWWVLSYSDLAKVTHVGIFVWVILTSLGRPVPTYPLPASSRTTEPVQFFWVVFQQQRFSNNHRIG